MLTRFHKSGRFFVALALGIWCMCGARSSRSVASSTQAAYSWKVESKISRCFHASCVCVESRSQNQQRFPRKAKTERSFALGLTWVAKTIHDMIIHHANRLHIGVANSQSDKLDRKSTRLNSSHVAISYAVYCL